MTRSMVFFFWVGLAILASLGLYNTSYRVHDLEKQLIGLNTQIDLEQRNIHVLKAEWVYLANPARIEQAARKYLAMNPTPLQQIAKLNKLPEFVPIQTNDAIAIAAAAPLPTVDSTVAAEPKTHKVVAKDETHINTRLVIERAAKVLTLPDGNGLAQTSSHGLTP